MPAHDHCQSWCEEHDNFGEGTCTLSRIVHAPSKLAPEAPHQAAEEVPDDVKNLQVSFRGATGGPNAIIVAACFLHGLHFDPNEPGTEQRNGFVAELKLLNVGENEAEHLDSIYTDLDGIKQMRDALDNFLRAVPHVAGLGEIPPQR